MQRAKRLFSHTFTSLGTWCVFHQPAKRQFSGRVEKAASRRSAYRVPPSGRAVSLDFFDLLKRCVDSDQDLRFVNGQIDLHHKVYASLLSISSAKAGKIERLRAGTGHATVATSAEAILEEAQLNKRLVARLDIFNRAKRVLPKVVERRKTNFRKLYRVAQAHLDHAAHSWWDGDRIIPDKFFSQMQEILDCHRTNQVQKTLTGTLRRQLIEKNKELHALDAGDHDGSERKTIVQSERQQLSKEYSAARFEGSVRESNIVTRERDLLNTIWPYVASEADMFGRISPNASEASRGDEHERMDRELPPAAKTVASNRDDLIRARDTAFDLLRAKIARHDGLAWRYFLDLESYMKEDSGHTRLEFDKQFVEDRTQAMKEVAIAESRLKHFTDRLKKEGRRRLQDCTSDFGDITDDGRVSSMGTYVMRDLRRRRQLDHPYIEQYLNNIERNDLRNPWSPVSPADHGDSDWNARSIALGDFDTFSQAEDPQTRVKIRRWREKMEELREEMRVEDEGSE